MSLSTSLTTLGTHPDVIQPGDLGDGPARVCLGALVRGEPNHPARTGRHVLRPVRPETVRAGRGRRYGGTHPSANTAVTELVYRKQIRPVLQQGATTMDQIFSGSS